MTTTKIYDDYAQLAVDVALEIESRVDGVDVNVSRKSCSTYVNFDVYGEDEDGDEVWIETKSVRISDHSPRYRIEEIVLNIDIKDDLRAETVYEDDIEDPMFYIGVEVDTWRFDDEVSKAVVILEGIKNNG